MSRRLSISSSLVGLIILLLAGPAFAENEGQDDLDKATQLKVTAESLDDLNKVIDSLDSAIEKGLDKDNAEIANEFLVGSLLQRGTLLSQAVFNVVQQDPQRAVRALQFRQMALTDLQRAVQVEPKLWDAQILIGRLQLLPLGDPNAAKRALSQVADSNDATAEQRAEALGLRSELQKDDAKQLEDLSRAIKLQPEVPDYLRLRAQHYLSQKKFDEALADAEKAIKLEPDHAATNELQGMILLGLEKYDDALKSFNRASELVPGAALPYQHRGELYRQKGDLEKAIEQLTKALELAPENVSILLVRAGVYYELKKPDRALEDIDQAIKQQPQLVEPYQMRAEVLASTDRLDQAIDELSKIIPRARNSAELQSRLGAFYMMASRPHKAIEVLNKAIEQDPSDFSALRLRADAYLSTGQHSQAIADFARLLPDSEKDESVLNNYAWVLATSPDDKIRDGKQALKLATQACELSGYATPHILSTLAAAYAESGDFENAQKWSEKAAETSQKEIEAAKTDEERTRLKSDHEQLQKEVVNYKDKKPTREKQSAEDAEPKPLSADHAAATSAPPAPARTADF